ncbi:hypothetical protein SUGI_0500400 [Cryptomeria japonica]|nr:hypothetical protein SUGI_0500400 [Cryptomeria japonica]
MQKAMEKKLRSQVTISGFLSFTDGLLSYCIFTAFKILAFNYLRIEPDQLYPLVEDKIAFGAEMTPAEIIDTHDQEVSNVVSVVDAKIMVSASRRQR